MKNKHGFNAKLILKDLMWKPLRVFAEEGATPPDPANAQNPSTPTPPPIAFETLIAKARKEEKDKLYPQITALQNEKNELVNTNNSLLLKIGTLETTLDTLKAQLTEKPSDSKESELLAVIEGLKSELKELTDNTVDEETLRAQIVGELEAKYKLDSFKSSEIAKASGKIIPELVSGTTEEEILASIEASKRRYSELTGHQLDKVPPVNTNAGSTVQGGGTSVSFEDLAKLDPKSPEYATLRRQLGLR